MDIRTPDQYYTEQLTPSTGNVQSNDLEKCLELSMIEYINKSLIDQELIYSELYSKYKKILIKYEKLNKYDDTIREFTSYIEPIIDEYCRHKQSISLDNESYLKMMATVNSIRLTTEEKELMSHLFSKY